jgi:dTMP kinase
LSGVNGYGDSTQAAPADEQRIRKISTLKSRGVFITLEGIDGTGKSTQLRLLVRHLRAQGITVRATREPGGTKLGNQIRKTLLSSRTVELTPLAELALIYAARAQHLEEVVRPALGRGEIVVSDRFNDASFAYQGYGRKLGTKIVRALDRVICGRTQPDLTLLLDLAAKQALGRARGREFRRNSVHSRFELESLKFHERVRAGYLAIVRSEPKRVKLIKADRPVAEVQAEVRRVVDEFLRRRNSGRRARK